MVTSKKTRIKDVGFTLIGIAVCLLTCRHFLSSAMVSNFLINEVMIDVPAEAQAVPPIDFSPSLKEELEASITFVGLLGNNLGPGFGSLLTQLSTLSSQFKRPQLVFIDGITSISSRNTFSRWVSTNNMHHNVHILVSNETDFSMAGDERTDSLPPREGRLSRARNRALSYIRENLPSTKYIVSIDMDIIGWDVSVVLDAFHRRGWDVMCGHGITTYGVYRDTYALRIAGINTNHHLHGLDRLNHNFTNDRRLRAYAQFNHDKERAKSLVRPRGNTNSLIPVESCFGGLAIYRFDAIGDCSYDYRAQITPGDYVLDCEHVLFHQCMASRNGAKIFSNPNMIIWLGHGILHMRLSLLWKKSKQLLIELGLLPLPEE